MFLRTQLESGRQVYVVYPLIEESEKLDAKAAAAEYELWRERLRPFHCELLHGRVPAPEKQEIMERFRRGETHALISTTVIEVGVDVANATVMLIENAERFGLAQLHQLRGRIGRGEHKSYCILLTSDQSKESAAKLAVLEKTTNGFEVAEADWDMRGPGDLLGTAQSGLPALKIGNLKSDGRLMQRARAAAMSIFVGGSAAGVAGESTFPPLDCRKTRTDLFQRELMKNLLKFFVFVALLSLGISALYDYRLRHGGLGTLGQRTPEKYTLASTPSVDSKASRFPRGLEPRTSRIGQRRNPISCGSEDIEKDRHSPGLRTRSVSNSSFAIRRQFRNPREEALVQNSLGSGVIVTNEGHIITNNHVVDQVDEIEVQLSDGRTEKARLIGADSQVDLAVLKIDNPAVKPLKLADSDTVQAGDFVLAIGNPFGFEETVTDGIISSKGRPNRADVFGDLLQTNAAINPGNSGGPLINLRGEVVGINTAIISRSGGSQGIGFAIPSNTVRMALESLLKQGRIIRGYLGIQMRAPQPRQPGFRKMKASSWMKSCPARRPKKRICKRAT